MALPASGRKIMKKKLSALGINQKAISAKP